MTYLEEHEYEDPSGKKVKIPAGCAVSQVEGENTLQDGLVIIDTNGNEWVWIEVPTRITESCETTEQIESALINYASAYRDSNFSDTWYEGCGLEPQEYAEKYSEMLQSIKDKGGFYIGRYEVGSFDSPVTTEDITRKAVIQKNAYPYNYVKCNQAQEIAKGIEVKGKTTSLMFGIQWDLILMFLENNGIDEEILKRDSTYWGNYKNNSFIATSGSYAIYDQNTLQLKSWNPVLYNYIKPDNGLENIVLITTGTSTTNSKMNIYDLAGNVYEWTLEKSQNPERPCVARGGYSLDNGFDIPVSYRNERGIITCVWYRGFRATIY